jgi:hypothetical protein
MALRPVTLTVIAALLLAACDSKTDANSKNFGAALSALFAQKGNFCLADMAWPVDISLAEFQSQGSIPTGTAAQMVALEANGLVSSTNLELDQLDMFQKPTGIKGQIKRYTLTDAAKPFYQDRPNSIFVSPAASQTAGALCWGKKTLGQIVKWEGPLKFGDYQEAVVIYTYKIDPIAPWAQKPDIQVAFPDIKPRIAAAGTIQQKHEVKLTSLGWEAPPGLGD